MRRRARLAEGWRQRQLARRARVHQPQIARVERGEAAGHALIARIARPLGLVPGLVAAAQPAPSQPQQPAHDNIDANVETWRAAWPEVDPEVFAILTRLRQA